MYITIRNVDKQVVRKLTQMAKKNQLSREEYLRLCLKKIADESFTVDSPMQMEIRQITTILDQMESTMDAMGKDLENVNAKLDAVVDSFTESGKGFEEGGFS